jgi:hypothetical protein
MSRVIIQTGDVYSEPFSTSTELQWLPGTLDGQAIFRPERVTTLNGAVIGRTREPDLVVPFADALHRLYPVTLPDGTQTELPGMVAMQILRAAFAHFYDARAAAEAVEVAAEAIDTVPALTAEDSAE